MKHFESRSFERLHSEVAPHALDLTISARRAERFRQVLARRTVQITVVVDDCFDPHNATAVLRTCEAFGLDEIHVVTPRNRFAVNRKISQGAHLYTTVATYESIEGAYATLRESGFRIVVASLAADSVTDPHDLSADLESSPLALVFGNEESGVSEEGLEQADGYFLVPMSGFTQSLNLSVTVGITLFSIRHIALSADLPGDMPVSTQRSRYDSWITRQSRRRQRE